MFIILAYDVASARNAKVLKICRKYLSHVQESVFEGNISESKMKNLQKELERVICTNEDRICIYRLDSLRYVSKQQIGLCRKDDIFL